MTSVLVVGSINIDEAIRVVDLPRPGQTVTASSLKVGLGGKGANQAVAAARAGADTRMLGAVGSDGAPVLRELAGYGVDTAAVIRDDTVLTGKAVVLVDDGAENCIVVVPGANAVIDDAAVDAACATLSPGDVLLLQHEVPTRVSALAAAAAKRAGATVVWNAAPAPSTRDELVPDLDVLVVNEHELAAIAALLGVPDAEPESLAHGVAEALRADVVCTLGAAGAIAVAGGVLDRVPTARVEAVDTTAAGDTFVGYLAALFHLPPRRRLETALAAATIAVTRPGAAASIPAIDEVLGADDVEVAS